MLYYQILIINFMLPQYLLLSGDKPRYTMTPSENESDHESSDWKPEMTRRKVMAAAGMGGLGALLSAGTGTAGAASPSKQESQARPWNQDVDAQGYNLKNLGALSTSASDATITDFAGENLEVDSDGVLNALSTNEGFSYERIPPGTPASDINDLLSSSGTYIFEAGDHIMENTIEISADDVNVIIEENAFVHFSDSAQPKTFDDQTHAETYGMLFYAENQKDITFVNHGIIDANHIYSWTNNQVALDALWMKNCDNLHLYNIGGRFRDMNEIFLIDSKNVVVWGVTSYGVSGQALTLEGLRDAVISNTFSFNGFEVIDMNGHCERCVVNGVYGGGTDQGIFEANSCRDIYVSDVHQLGSDATNTILEFYSSTGQRFTDKSAPNTEGNIEVHNVTGTANQQAVTWQTSHPAPNCTLTGLDVKSTGDTAVDFVTDVDGGFDNLTVEGTVESDSAHAFGHGARNDGDTSKNIDLDLKVLGANWYGASLSNVSDVQGQVNADVKNAIAGVNVYASGSACENINLDLNISGADIGLQVEPVNGGDVQNCRFTGIVRNNSTADVNIKGGTDNVFDLTYDTLQGQSKGTRSVINGLGYNSGNPQSTGQWNGNGIEGVKVRDTDNQNTYLYNNGTFSQIAGN